MEKFKRFKYKNLLFLFISLVFALFISRFEAFHSFLINLNNFGYLGAFLAGILFVSTFTISTGIVILLVLAEKLSPLEIGLIAGLGAVTGDLLMFRFAKNDLLSELELIFMHFERNQHVNHVIHSKYFGWTLPVIGAFIIASPLPDEVGVSLLGISQMKTYKFFILSFILNAVGIFLVISASLVIKP